MEGLGRIKLLSACSLRLISTEHLELEFQGTAQEIAGRAVGYV